MSTRAVGRGQDVNDRAHYPPHQREATQVVHRRRTEETPAAALPSIALQSKQSGEVVRDALSRSGKARSWSGTSDFD